MILHNSSLLISQWAPAVLNRAGFTFFVAGFGFLFKKVRFKYSVLNQTSEETRSFVLVKSWNSKEQSSSKGISEQI